MSTPTRKRRFDSPDRREDNLNLAIPGAFLEDQPESPRSIYTDDDKHSTASDICTWIASFFKSAAHWIRNYVIAPIDGGGSVHTVASISPNSTAKRVCLQAVPELSPIEPLRDEILQQETPQMLVPELSLGEPSTNETPQQPAPQARSRAPHSKRPTIPTPNYKIILAKHTKKIKEAERAIKDAFVMKAKDREPASFGFQRPQRRSRKSYARKSKAINKTSLEADGSKTNPSSDAKRLRDIQQEAAVKETLASLGTALEAGVAALRPLAETHTNPEPEHGVAMGNKKTPAYAVHKASGSNPFSPSHVQCAAETQLIHDAKLFERRPKKSVRIFESQIDGSEISGIRYFLKKRPCKPAYRIGDQPGGSHLPQHLQHPRETDIDDSLVSLEDPSLLIEAPRFTDGSPVKGAYDEDSLLETTRLDLEKWGVDDKDDDLLPSTAYMTGQRELKLLPNERLAEDAQELGRGAYDVSMADIEDSDGNITTVGDQDNFDQAETSDYFIYGEDDLGDLPSQPEESVYESTTEQSQTSSESPSEGSDSDVEPGYTESLVVDLSPDLQQIIADAVAQGFGGNVQLKGSFTGEDLSRLIPDLYTNRAHGPTGWLNDEAIDNYFALLSTHANNLSGVDVSRKSSDPYLYHAYSSKWYDEMRSKGHQGVARWTRKPRHGQGRLLQANVLLFPINVGGAHWTLLTIRPTLGKIAYHDSMGISRPEVFRVARDWLKGELGAQYDESAWEDLFYGRPAQANGSDCGVFTIMNGLCTVRNLTGAFSQRDIPSARWMIAATILSGGFPGVLNFNTLTN